MTETEASNRAGRSPRGPRLVRGADVTREPPKDRLSVDRIVDAAMDLMERKGYDAVSMRSLAQALDTGPASLYAHVANREHLDQLVLGRIAAQLELPTPDPDRWVEQVKDVMRQMLELYRAHPGSARAAMAMIPTHQESMRAMEGLLALCLAGGITPQAAAWFCDLAPQYVGSVAAEELIWVSRENSTGAGEEPDHAAIDDQISEIFESLPPAQFPHLTALARVVTNGDDVDRFEFGLDVLLSGLTAASPRYA
jgi:AcrR family transcriptional regulator